MADEAARRELLLGAPTAAHKQLAGSSSLVAWGWGVRGVMAL